MKNWKRLLALGLSIVMSITVLTSCGKSGQDSGESLSVCVGEAPLTFDPIYAERLSDQTVLAHMYENLMRVSTNSEGATVVTEGAAKNVSVEENADGTVTYTFRLQDGKWSDGVPVKANDFVYAWQRIVNPSYASPFASMLSIISGYDEARATGDMSKLAVTAKSANTLVVTLDGNYDWFLREVCTSPVTVPLRQDVLKKLYEASKDLDPDGTLDLHWWTNATKAVTNGPFVVMEQDGDTSLTLTANPHYHQKRSGPEKIVFRFGDEKTAEKLYETGEVDAIAPLSESWMASLLETDENWVPDPELVTHTVMFNCERLTDEHVRKALSLAVDRNAIAEIAGVTAKAAEGLVPPGVPEGDGDFRAKGGTLIDHDPETYADRCTEAISLLESSGYESGASLGEIEYFYVAEGHNGAVAAALCENWNRVLKTRITPKAVTREELLTALKSGDYVLAEMDVSAVCNDAECFLMDFTIGNSKNYLHYGNSAYDTLMSIIAIAEDGSARMGCLHDAEDLLLNIDCALAPLHTCGTAWTLRESYSGAIRDTRGWFSFANVYKRPAV